MTSVLCHIRYLSIFDKYKLCIKLTHKREEATTHSYPIPLPCSRHKEDQSIPRMIQVLSEKLSQYKHACQACNTGMQYRTSGCGYSMLCTQLTETSGTGVSDTCHNLFIQRMLKNYKTKREKSGKRVRERE